MVAEIKSGVRGAKGRGRWEGEVHFKRRELGDGFVGNRIVGIADSLSVERPCRVLRWGEITHSPVPKSPPGFDFAVRLRVVAACGSTLRACDCGDGGHQFAEEFRCIIGVEDIG